jgi:DNA helicase-2/ATP-dependent DNA helicase PcrA
MSKYAEALGRLNDAQKKAVETIDGPVLVIAGPGTGKTQLLTTRIAHILAKTDTLPQNILCLTFTDSAAQTMQGRLANMIGQSAYDVTIGTYHAFGSDLIRRFPEYFADYADMQPADDLTIDGIFRSIIRGLPFGNPLKHADLYLSDLKTLISDSKRALLSPEDLRDIAKDNLAFITRTNSAVQQALQGIVRIDKKSIPAFAALAKKITPRSTVQQWQPLDVPFARELDEAVQAAEESGKTTSITAWKNSWLAKDNTGSFIVDGAKANQKLLAAADVYEAYLKELAMRGLFDYDDMILRAVRVLEQNNDLRYTLQEQYLYILLDEFQDTNGAQLRLVELLTDNPANEGRPNVLAVGDDDQAIYAFQGADYSHMLQFNNLYRDVTVVPLTENYRSHPDILHTARGIAEQIEERLHHHFPAIEKTLVASGKDLPKNAIVERREAASDVMQFAWTANRIAQLIQDGIPPSEIAVLAPKHKHLEPLVPYLSRASVPVRYEKREDVLDDPAIKQLLRMSELALALSRGEIGAANALWAEVLSFDFWDIPTSTIWSLSWQTKDAAGGWTDTLLQTDTLKPIALFFIRLGQLAKTQTLETMLDYLIGNTALELKEPDEPAYTSPYYHYYFGSAGDQTVQARYWNLLNNLIVLRARLREYRKEDDSQLTLQDFIVFVEAHRAAEIKILNTSPYASGTDAVLLMTAFKSKGMEFAAVFVLATNDETWGSKVRTQSSRISLPLNLQHVRYAGATPDERLRLFYVAITRAKSQLYIVNYRQTYAGKQMTRLKYLTETTDEQESISPLLPENAQRILPAEDNTPQPTTELAAYWQQRHESALSSGDMQSLLQDRLKHFQLSPTHVCNFIDIANSGPQTFFLQTILRFPQAPSARMQYGNAIHETLEWIHYNAKQLSIIPDANAVGDIFAKRLQNKGINTLDVAQFLERGKATLTNYLEHRAHTILPDSVVEYNFKNEGVFVGAAHLSGKIDKLIINNDTKEIIIVDYKTGRSHNRWAREISLHKYRHQLYLYKALVEGSHTFASYRVTDAYLEFVEPDEDGMIHELHVSFDDAEYDRVKRLTEAVWQRITTLDLPNTTDYSADLGGIEAFEADLLLTNL